MGAGKTKKGLHNRAPVDQQRKADRARELKRNRRDRNNVREAIAKFGGDETQTVQKLIEIERQLVGLDDARFHMDVLNKKKKALMGILERKRSAFANSKGATDGETLDKINSEIKSYHAECARLKRESDMLRLARATDVNTIPLPEGDFSQMLAQQPLPVPKVPVILAPPQKRRRKYEKGRALPPGVPVGLPPDFSDSEDEREGRERREEHRDVLHRDDDDLAPVPMPAMLDSAPALPPLLLPIRAPPLPPPRMDNTGRPMLPPAPGRIPLPPPPVNPAAPPAAGVTGNTATIHGAASITAQPVIIAAQPQLRDLKSESTRLVPAQLLRPRSTVTKSVVPKPQVRTTSTAKLAKSTDEAYDEFMKEMGEFI